MVFDFKNNFYVIAGPCIIENKEMLQKTADKLKNIANKLNIQLIFKASFDKANRTSYDSFRGPGIEKGLLMLDQIKKEFDLPVTTDVHTPDQIKSAVQCIDIIQLPAFLARQTDFYVEAGKYDITLNVKKGQFMSPYDMSKAISKFKESNGKNIMITERGTFFGYGNLVVDFRSIEIIKSMGVPYTFDATHSVQLPSAKDGKSGGQREFISGLIRGQMAAGSDGLFMETHPNVKLAKSDKDSQIPLEYAEKIITNAYKIYSYVRDNKLHENFLLNI